ncbi:MAG: helix-turn-helix domain-containing protein [Polyangiales bacterium]
MKPTVPDDAALLAALRSAARPLHISEVATHLGLPLSSRRRLSDALAALVERGLVHEMPGARYRLPKQAGATLEGRFTQHPRGFGFVTANDGGADVFVPNTAILGAMHGDLVAVTATDGPRGREGVVTEVLKRRPATVPGALRVRPKGSWVEPDDARIRSPITLREAPQARDGDAVIVEVTQWPEHPGETPQGGSSRSSATRASSRSRCARCSCARASTRAFTTTRSPPRPRSPRRSSTPTARAEKTSRASTSSPSTPKTRATTTTPCSCARCPTTWAGR